LYGKVVKPSHLPTTPIYLPSNLPVFAGQPPHKDQAGSVCNQQTVPQQILMTPPVYPSFQHSKFAAQIPVNIPRPSGVVRGTSSYLACSGDSTAGQIATSSTTGKQT